MTDTKNRTPGERLVIENFSPDGRPWSTPKAIAAAFLIDKAVAEAEQRGFRAGFEHAVAGGEEAGGLMGDAGKDPLVLYFESEVGRREMVAALIAAPPGMVECRIPERKK